ncbi:protein of unknown function [Candidatus Promineifilum breve]|uniref:Uncharacterized protein n=1 Tax=Candidatus Promineifilum breve TaxID=1806508 RepID=A0A160T8S1_9CHLR|nr:protein of unknown function [Candidatus Promineifilum breve]
MFGDVFGKVSVPWDCSKQIPVIQVVGMKGLVMPFSWFNDEAKGAVQGFDVFGLGVCR